MKKLFGLAAVILCLFCFAQAGFAAGRNGYYRFPAIHGDVVVFTSEGDPWTGAAWRPDGKILYATQKSSTLPNTQLVILDPATNAETLLPLNQAADGSFDAAGKELFFTRLPFQGSYTKRYKGGTAQTLWAFPIGSDH